MAVKFQRMIEQEICQRKSGGCWKRNVQPSTSAKDKLVCFRTFTDSASRQINLG